MKNILPTFRFEKPLWKKGYYVIGVDEVGRGALAGPLTVGAVCFSPQTIEDGGWKIEKEGRSLKLEKSNFHHLSSKSTIYRQSSTVKSIQTLGINDSKKLSPQKREKLAKLIKKSCLAYATASISNRIINKVGITRATQIAMRKAIKLLIVNCYLLRRKKLFVLADAFYIRYLKGIGLRNQLAIKHGDKKSISIAAASIIAKVERDHNMVKLGHKYPIYFWKNNKGYGTRKHIEAIKKFGKSKFHRDLFLRKILSS